jgi:endonuclease YncB( thermonuclease family)
MHWSSHRYHVKTIQNELTCVNTIRIDILHTEFDFPCFQSVLSPPFFLAIAAAPAVGTDSSGIRFKRQVVGIKDGDTLAVVLAGLLAALNPVGVRLRGVDTPESGGRAKCTGERALAARATRFTHQAMTTAGSIEFEDPSWDKYGGRIDAWIDGKRLADQLIAAGLARRYDGGKRASWC